MNEGLISRFRAGDRRALARLISHIEDETELGLEAMRHLRTTTFHPHLIGITGPPGAGKSTLVNGMITELRRREISVGALLIDPSSPVSGGATLGDRIRTLEQKFDDLVFIRSMSTRGSVGGLNLAIFASVELLGTFGFDVILIETVGVGQDEVDIASIADTVIVLQIPGAGDGVQIIKAGLLEIADIHVVNKVDLDGGHEFMRQMRSLLASTDKTPGHAELIATSATSGNGIPELVDAIEYRQNAESEAIYTERRQKRVTMHARALANVRIRREIESSIESLIRSGDASEDAMKLADQAIQLLRKNV